MTTTMASQSQDDAAARPARPTQPVSPSHARPAAHHDPKPVPVRPIDMVAIDIDGTLLRTDKMLSVRNARAIEKVLAKGVKVVLASARPPRSVCEIHNRLKLDTLQVNYNGALIYDTLKRRNVHHQPLVPALAQKIIKAARKADPKVVVSMEILDKWYTDHMDESLPTETSRHFAPDFVGPLEAFWHVPLTKLMLLAPPERMVKIQKVVSSKFQGQISLAISDQHLLQVIDRGVDKAAALQRVAEHYNIPASRVMAIGDAPNDVGMLKWAGLGVAMGNAWDVTRKAADVVVPTNDEDGVAYALKRYILDV